MVPEPFKITLAGVEYECPPLTVGQRRRIDEHVLRHRLDDEPAEEIHEPAADASQEEWAAYRAASIDKLVVKREASAVMNAAVVSIALKSACPEMAGKDLIEELPGLTESELLDAAFTIMSASGWVLERKTMGESKGPATA